MKPLLIFLLSTLPLSTKLLAGDPSIEDLLRVGLRPGQPPRVEVLQVQVRLVSIEKNGATTALEAAAPDCDEKLWAALSADVAAGHAKFVHDQVVVVRNEQRSLTSASRQFPIEVDAKGEPSEWMRYAYNFSNKLLGQTLEVEAEVAGRATQNQTGRFISVNLAPQWATLLAMHPWPVPDSRGEGKMGHTLHPVFATHSLSNQVLTWTGRTVLLSIAASPQSAMTEQREPSFRYTFLRAGIDGERPAPAGTPRDTPPVEQRRLHLISIRLPRNEAAALMLREGGDDAALYASLSSRVADGTASLSGHTAILCRMDQRSKVESQTEFHFVGHYTDYIPDVWGALFPGYSLEAEAESWWQPARRDRDGKPLPPLKPEPSEDSEGTRGRWSLTLRHLDGPELVPFYPSAKHPTLHGTAPEYVQRELSHQFRISPSGVRCSAVLSSTPPTDDGKDSREGFTDVYFALQSPPPARPGPAPKPCRLLHSLILSLPAAEAATCAPGDSATPLIERLQNGEIDCAAHVAIALRRGTRASAECVRHVQQPWEFAPSAVAPEVRLPGSWGTAGCGVSLEAEYAETGDDITINATMEWDTAQVLSLGKPGAPVPESSARRCMQKIELRSVHLLPHEPVIADVRASNAREGTREHGRWHVLVLLAR